MSEFLTQRDLYDADALSARLARGFEGPTVKMEEDGRLVIHWPSNGRHPFLISPELFEQLITDLNAADLRLRRVSS